MPDINRVLEGALQLFANKIAPRLGEVLEDTRGAPLGLAEALKKAPEYIRKIPAFSIRMQGAIPRAFQNDSGYIAIHSLHPDPKIAELGKAIEEMLEKPLARKFRRNKLHFFIAPDHMGIGEDLAQAGNGGGWLRGSLRIMRLSKLSPQINGMKVVAIPASHFEALSMEELKALTGHEIGHQLRGDFHPRRGLEATNRRTQDSERLADQVGIYLSGKPEAFKTGLDKVVQSHIDGISNLGDSWLERVAKRNASRDISDRSTRIYPSLNERKKIADELATKMSTPEGRSYLEAELMRRLEAEHSKLFPHHYSRDGGVTRG